MYKTKIVSIALCAALGLATSACDKSAEAGPEAADKDEDKDKDNEGAHRKSKEKKASTEDDDEADEVTKADKVAKADEVGEIDVDSLLEAADEASGVLSSVELEGIDTSKAPVLGRDVGQRSEAVQKAEWLPLPGGQLEIPFPPDWRKTKQGNVGIIMSGDQKTAIVFTTVKAEAEVGLALQQLGQAIGVTEVTWKQPKAVQFGPDGLPALVRAGNVTVATGHKGRVFFAIVDTGGPEKVLAVALEDADATEQSSKQAEAVLLSIRRKR